MSAQLLDFGNNFLLPTVPLWLLMAIQAFRAVAIHSRHEQIVRRFMTTPMASPNQARPSCLPSKGSFTNVGNYYNACNAPSCFILFPFFLLGLHPSPYLSSLLIPAPTRASIEG